MHSETSTSMIAPICSEVEASREILGVPHDFLGAASIEIRSGPLRFATPYRRRA